MTEDDNIVLANQGQVAMQVTQPGGVMTDLGLMQMVPLVKLHVSLQMRAAPPSGQICNPFLVVPLN